MHSDIIQQFDVVFSEGNNILQPWTKPLKQNKKSIFEWKNPSVPKSMLFAKF